MPTFSGVNRPLTYQETHSFPKETALHTYVDTELYHPVRHPLQLARMLMTGRKKFLKKVREES
uniref:Uncharacterized protein n=1 Tax=Romanomermis culicivorax TaxID=13658 RepID=A0A915KLE3_ROMCU